MSLSSSTTSFVQSNRINIVVVGCGEVGKSTLCVQYVRNVFLSSYDPTIMDSLMKIEHLSGRNVALTIVDTAGQDDYVSLRSSYLRAADAILFVYSVLDVASLQALPTFWEHTVQSRRGSSLVLNSSLSSMNNQQSGAASSDFRIPFLVVGNKTDLPFRAVSEDQGRRMALSFISKMSLSTTERAALERRPPYLETSATIHDDAVCAFQTLATMVLKYRSDSQITFAPQSSADIVGVIGEAASSPRLSYHSRHSSYASQCYRDVPDDDDDADDADALTVEPMNNNKRPQVPLKLSLDPPDDEILNPNGYTATTTTSAAVMTRGGGVGPSNAGVGGNSADQSAASLSDLMSPPSAVSSPLSPPGATATTGAKKKKKKKKSVCVLV